MKTTDKNSGFFLDDEGSDDCSAELAMIDYLVQEVDAKSRLAAYLLQLAALCLREQMRRRVH